jgi:hypothetical protein
VANPRNTTDYKGVGYRGQTFKIDGSSITFDQGAVGGSEQAGMLVGLKPGATSTVALASATVPVFGVLMSVKHDGACTVQHQGGAQITLAAAQSPEVGDYITGGATAGLGYVAAEAAPGMPRVVKVVSGTVVQVLLTN